MAAPSNLEFTVKVSYMEIYMEKVRDLLNRKCVAMCTAILFFFTNHTE